MMKTTNSTILLRSNHNHHYYLSDYQKTLIFLHPIMFFLLSLIRKGIDVETWHQNLTDAPIQIQNYGEVSKKEIDYYYRKYLFLKEKNLLLSENPNPNIDLDLVPEMIQKSLANTRQVTLEVTDSCNLMCEYCGYGKFYSNYEKRENQNLSLSNVKGTLIYLSQLWNSSLNDSRESNIFISFYGGEPLLNFPLIEKSVSFAESLPLSNNRFLFSMTTNGILLNKYMDFLVKKNFHLLISLDGDESASAYRKLKNGHPAFKIITGNIEALKDKYPSYFREKVNFNAVLHNKNSVPEIYNYFKRTYDKLPRIAPLNTTGIKPDMQEEFWKTYASFDESLLSPQEYSTLENDLFIILPNIQELSNFIHSYTPTCYKDYNDLLYRNSDATRIPTGTCIPFSKKVFISVKGKILPCERIGHEYALAEIKDGAINIDFDDIAARYNHWFHLLEDQCQKCYRSYNCSQCIFQLNDLNTHPKCNGFSSYISYSKYLKRHLDKLEKNPKIYTRIYNKVVIE